MGSRGKLLQATAARVTLEISQALGIEIDGLQMRSGGEQDTLGRGSRPCCQAQTEPPGRLKPQSSKASQHTVTILDHLCSVFFFFFIVPQARASSGKEVSWDLQTAPCPSNNSPKCHGETHEKEGCASQGWRADQAVRQLYPSGIQINGAPVKGQSQMWWAWPFYSSPTVHGMYIKPSRKMKEGMAQTPKTHFNDLRHSIIAPNAGQGSMHQGQSDPAETPACFISV